MRKHSPRLGLLIPLLLCACSAPPAPDGELVSTEIVAGDEGYVVMRTYRSADGSLIQRADPITSNDGPFDLGNPDATRIDDPDLDDRDR